VFSIEIGQTVAPQLEWLAIQESGFGRWSVVLAKVSIGCLSLRIIEPFEVPERPDSDERLERNSAVSRWGFAEPNGIVMEVDRPTLGVRRDVDHTSETGGDDMSSAVMTREGRRVKRALVHSNASTYRVHQCGHLGVDSAHKLDNVAEG
jgi:hypothetical protein